MAISNLSAQIAEKILKGLGCEEREKLISGLTEAGGFRNVIRTNEKDSCSPVISQHGFIDSEKTGTSSQDVIVLRDSDDDSEHEEGGKKPNRTRSEESSFSSASETSNESEDESDSEGSKEDVKENPDERNLALPKCALSDFSAESDEDDWDVITIDDDDDNKEKRDAPKEMVCFRCPSKKTGAFKDKEKYWIHVKRHTFANHFSCPTCHRPFLTINFCISHEIRVHGTKLEYNNHDKSISFAKKYVEEKRLKKIRDRSGMMGENSKAAPAHAFNSTSEVAENQETDDTDCEDPKFYNNYSVGSTALYGYKGAPVTHILESYEIQLNHSRPKFSRANVIARLALDVHKQNLAKGQDFIRTGRFSKVQKPTTKASKKKPAQNSRTSVKRPRAVKESIKEPVNNNKPKEKRKIIRYMYITSSSSSEDDDSGDSDYQPSEPKRRRLENDKVDRDSDYSAPQTSGRRRTTRNAADGKEAIKKYLLNPIMDHVCHKCNYVWKTEADLRVHRDYMHSNLPLADLMAVQVKQACKGSSKQNMKKSAWTSEAKKKGKKPVAVVVKNGKQKKNGVAKKKVVVKKKAGPLLQTPWPMPDSTFSEKEIFLNALGLSHSIRLHTHLRKPVNDLKLPECYVKLERIKIKRGVRGPDSRYTGSLVM